MRRCYLSTPRSYLKPQVFELSQGLRIAPGIIHRVVCVLGQPVLFPFRRFMGVLHQTGVKVADAPARKPKRVMAEETMEVVIDELPIKGRIVRDKNRMAFGV